MQRELKPREPLNYKANITDLMLQLAEGNPGGLTVCKQLIEMGDQKELKRSLEVIRRLESMNIRGSQLWVVFKDLAGGDIMVFKSLILNPPDTLIDHVNTECPEHTAREAFDVMTELKGL